MPVFAPAHIIRCISHIFKVSTLKKIQA